MILPARISERSDHGTYTKVLTVPRWSRADRCRNSLVRGRRREPVRDRVRVSSICGPGAVALSSGQGAGLPVRHRLEAHGNRTVNSIVSIVSVTQARDQPETKAYLEPEVAEDKTKREARRAHKRQLSNRIVRRIWRDTEPNQPIPTPA